MNASHHEYRLVAPSKRETRLYWTQKALEVFSIMRHEKPLEQRDALVADIEAHAIKRLRRESVNEAVVLDYFKVNQD